MKRVIILLLMVFCLWGCKKENNTNIVKEFKDKVQKSDSYNLIGKMELNNDEEQFLYDIVITYLEDDYYKVELVNKANSHKQIILKNDDGLYVITPSLNKSFKFESNWPANSSQAYILKSLITDIDSDDNVKAQKGENGYIIESKVDYPNNLELKNQKIYLDDSFVIKKVEVYSKDNILKIKVEFTDVDLNAGIKKEDFKLENFIDETKCEEEADCQTETSMSKIESAIYPLYMPTNTYLSGSEFVNTEDQSRVILTFSGEKNFVIVEEKTTANLEHEVIPIYGEPLMLNDTIAALSSNSMYWTNSDVDYYIVSEDLAVSEMISIASSLGNVQSTIAAK